MPELPEITILANQMNRELAGRRFSDIEVIQPKSLNLPVEDFKARLVGQQVQQARAHGKWIITATTDGYVLINLGMGGEVLLRPGRHDLPEKYRLILDLEGGDCLVINFWW
jgi:formamidopyrimidine-DNA glycosylase